MSADVEVTETRHAGWLFRCHRCDITEANLDEVSAQLRTERHVHRAERAPWRFDVPEVPARVTALQSVERIYELDDHRWVRMPGDRWAPVWPDGKIGTARLSLIALAAYAPLVECVDPRSTA